MQQKSLVIREGLIVGIIGSVAAAAFYGIFDLLAARGAFFTVNMLGKFVFDGVRDPAVLQLPMQPAWGVIAMYSVLHIVVSLVVGIIVVGLIVQSRHRPSQIRLIMVAIVAGFVVTIAAVGMFTSAARAVLPWWSVVLANSIAVIAAAMYIREKHPEAWNRLSPFGG